MTAFLALMTLIFFWPPAVRADINSGCPSWGCLSSGSFSLSSGVPRNGNLKWSRQIAQVTEKLPSDNLRGCVSDQVAVVCATPNGYVSLDPITGDIIWNYTLMNYPYLPIMDVNGDVIGMDKNQLVYVEGSGYALKPIDISEIQPAYSVMLANNSIFLLTSSKADTEQIVIYNTNGIVCGAISLRENVNNISGTFIPAGHPIIVGYRAYIITRFRPDPLAPPKSQASTETYRLYAFDLWDHPKQEIRTAWNFDLNTDQITRLKVLLPKNKGTDRNRTHKLSSVLPPTVSYFQDRVYVNIPTSNQDDPQNGVLWGIKDNGDTASIIFTNPCVYGQMVVYDTYDLPQVEALYLDRTIWISAKESILINGYSSLNGSHVGDINITKLANINLLTSKLAITRKSHSSTSDILIVGGTALNGTAYLVAIDTESSTDGRLLWKTRLSDENLHKNVTWEVVGQLVNVAESSLNVNGTPFEWRLGIVAMVSENGDGYSNLYIKAVY